MSNTAGRAEFTYRVTYESDIRKERMLSISSTNSSVALTRARDLVREGRDGVQIEVFPLEV